METNQLNQLYQWIIIVTFLCLLACSQNKMIQKKPLQVEPGVSKNLAEYRKKVISQLSYTLSIDIPAEKEQPIQASEILSFHLKENLFPLQLDFKENTDHIQSIKANGRVVPIKHINEHIVIDSKFLKEGPNQLTIRFVAGDLSLNRSEDYLYTLLVPDRTRTVFPSFDQPDLKATYKLSLSLPKHWKALANAPLQDSIIQRDSKTLHFASSDTLPTYLFSFAAGEFEVVSREIEGRKMNFYHRETDQEKLKESLDSIFILHRQALTFLEEYTGIPYPFQKFDFIAIPDFQYGGMEHAGAIDYKASALFLDKGATTSQKVARSNLIAHETAHMWFGDLVTMRWFDDVWMKEVFANFMADKITEITIPEANVELKFLADHFPAAYGIDRTEGANPIRQPLENLQDAGTLYGNIIYHKAPIVMRQLERLMGEEAFREGLREYLRTYAHSNATWPELIAILDARTSADLQAWNEVWVNQTGRPKFTYQLETLGNQIKRLRLTQKGEDGSNRVWPQLFEVALVYPGRIEELTVTMNGKETILKEAEGKAKPLYIIFNSTGLGYGVFPVDEQMIRDLYRIPDPVTRMAAYINLYENMLAGEVVSPERLLDVYRKGLLLEKEELNLTLLTGQLDKIFWQFIPADERDESVTGLEKELWKAMQENTRPTSKKVLFQTYQSIALSKEALDRLYKIWESQHAPAGVKLTEDDYTSLATSLAIKEYPNADQILEKQLARIQNPDRKKRLQFLLPALSNEVEKRDAFFYSLKDAKNREKEAWVSMALGYLHHPLRARNSQKYLEESLNLLEEIQLTGDIFFPTNWLKPSFSSYQNPEVAQLVRKFLAGQPNYNPRLKAKILQAADDVFRAEKLLSGEE